MSGISRLTGKIGRQLMKCKPIAKIVVKASHNSPEILAITGTITVVTSFVLAIRAGTKVKETMATTADKVEATESRQKERREKELYTDENGKLAGEQNETALAKLEKKELTKVRAEGIWQVTKLFILPTGLLAIGIFMIGGGHHILRKRNIVLASALKGTEEMFKFYRGNVIEAEGKEADLKYLRGVVDDKEVETYVVDENGKEKKVKRNVPVVKDHTNPWRFIFDDVHFNTYEDDTDRNLFFLKCSQEWWNNQFDRYGEINMYEILKYLGYKFEVDKDGMSRSQYRDRMTFLRNYGWRKGCGGDDFIDFGLYRAINEPAMTRKTDVVWIEFNCDGNLENLSEWPYVQNNKEQNTVKYGKRS